MTKKNCEYNLDTKYIELIKEFQEKQKITKVITVKDTSGAIFPNAMVRLYPTPTINPHPGIIIDDTLYTDNQGEATFDYTEQYNLGQAGFAVLDIEVRSGDTLYGTGIIKVEAEVTSKETVILQP